jgi:hypothetical protein
MLPVKRLTYAPIPLYGVEGKTVRVGGKRSSDSSSVFPDSRRGEPGGVGGVQEFENCTPSTPKQAGLAEAVAAAQTDISSH